MEINGGTNNIWHISKSDWIIGFHFNNVNGIYVKRCNDRFVKMKKYFILYFNNLKYYDIYKKKYI